MGQPSLTTSRYAPPRDATCRNAPHRRVLYFNAAHRYLSRRISTPSRAFYGHHGFINATQHDAPPRIAAPQQRNAEPSLGIPLFHRHLAPQLNTPQRDASQSPLRDVLISPPQRISTPRCATRHNSTQSPSWAIIIRFITATRRTATRRIAPQRGSPPRNAPQSPERDSQVDNQHTGPRGR